MTEPTQDPSWIYPGAPVAEYSSSGFRPYTTVTSVERLTATLIVCTSGNRYNRKTLLAIGERARVELLPLSERVVMNALAGQAVSALGTVVSKKAARVSYKTSVTDANLLLDEIEAAVAKVRRQINRLLSPNGQEP